MKKLDLFIYTTNDSQDLQISRRILNGEKDLFELLTRPYQEDLFHLIKFCLRTQEDIQSTMIKAYAHAYSNLYRFYGQTSFLSWLLAIGIRKARKCKVDRLQNDEPSSSKELNSENAEPSVDQLISMLKKNSHLTDKEICFCLGITPADIKIDKRAIKGRRNDTSNSSRDTDNPVVYQNPLKIFMKTLQSPLSNNGAADQTETEDNPIAFDRLASEKNKDINEFREEHRENLMLCTNIRNGFVKGVKIDRIKQYTDWYWNNHLSRHFKDEEKVIFPILGKNNQLVKKALADHRRLTRLFRSDNDIHKMLNRIEEELEAHVRFEEKILFKEVAKTNASSIASIESLHEKKDDPLKAWQDPFWQ